MPMPVDFLSAQSARSTPEPINVAGSRTAAPEKGSQGKTTRQQQQQAGGRQHEGEAEVQHIGEPLEAAEEVVEPLGHGQLVAGIPAPGEQLAHVLAEDLNAAEAPAEPLALEGREGERHDALAKRLVQVQARPSGLQQPQRGLGVLGDAPFVPALESLQRAAPDQAHGPGEDDGVALVA
jgi:hypothetical protein